MMKNMLNQEKIKQFSESTLDGFRIISNELKVKLAKAQKDITSITDAKKLALDETDHGDAVQSLRFLNKNQIQEMKKDFLRIEVLCNQLSGWRNNKTKEVVKELNKLL